MKKTLALVLIMVLAVSMFTACAAKNQPAATPIAKDIMDETTDAMGNEVEEVQLAEALTIVSTAPSITEILFALGVGEQVIGVDAFSNYPDAALNIEKVGDFSGFDVEKVVALNPGIVFAGNGLQHEQIAMLEDAGLNVVSVEPTYYEDIAASISLIGEQVGKADEAAALIAKIETVASQVSAKAQGSQKPSVYYAMSIGDNGYWTSGQGSFINTIIEMAGGAPITANSGMEWMEYPTEDLILADPDVLIISSWITEDDLKADAVMKALSAVKDGKYLIISDDIINRPSPRITEAMTILQGFFLGE